jgi:hypothetical protein
MERIKEYFNNNILWKMLSNGYIFSHKFECPNMGSNVYCFVFRRLINTKEICVIYSNKAAIVLYSNDRIYRILKVLEWFKLQTRPLIY